jgi:hypothetical protein
MEGRSSEQKAAQRNCCQYKYRLPLIIHTVRLNCTDARRLDKLETPTVVSVVQDSQNMWLLNSTVTLETERRGNRCL